MTNNLGWGRGGVLAYEQNAESGHPVGEIREEGGVRLEATWPTMQLRV